MRRVLAVLAVSVVVVACGAASPTARPGSSAVYERIAAMTDCRALQQEFDMADSNHKRDLAAGRTEQATWSTAYMKAADERMKAMKCY